ncbi:hypothetical protein TKK_0007008 [Trichogramma kaykai]
MIRMEFPAPGERARAREPTKDSYTKPQTFADCIGNELPLGWEEACDKHVGVYYINHVNQTTQLEDPRQEWRGIQEAMLRDYLQTAQDALETAIVTKIRKGNARGQHHETTIRPLKYVADSFPKDEILYASQYFEANKNHGVIQIKIIAISTNS